MSQRASPRGGYHWCVLDRKLGTYRPGAREAKCANPSCAAHISGATKVFWNQVVRQAKCCPPGRVPSPPKHEAREFPEGTFAVARLTAWSDGAVREGK